eukprot:CAMPEP_0206419462 /NCGR_PEP_ID=MMETSP0324_2-20121206/142_1 /ASSEMBLY_ACC=CAM_ASM_000836 /TAXON_ID=2866 /ORGANISM="Crypthecodinium cohnii, Strain Seligo" /LENGTH=50 /DNA_ID=CAMNT_0053882921 /DNA_START=108 /DNA_END=256 /DNA_ORIENTATION=+
MNGSGAKRIEARWCTCLLLPPWAKAASHVLDVAPSNVGVRYSSLSDAEPT